MLVNGRALARDARNDDPGVLVRGNGFAFEEGRRLIEHGPVAALADVAGEHVGQPQMRVGGLRPLAEARAAAGRAMPPFEHVAFAKLLARVQHDLRPRQPRLRQGQRQHILQLIAIAGRAAKLVRAEAAEQPRRVELVGQPDVDQPVEVRPVGADLDPAQPLGPGCAGRGKLAFRLGDANARGGVQRFGPARGLAEDDRDLCFAPGRERELAAEGGHAPAVVARARRRSRPSRPSPASGCCVRGRRRNGRGWSRSRDRRKLVAAKAKPRSKSLLGFWKRSVDPTVSSRILSTLAFGLSSSARSKNGATRRRFGLGP